jgi:hypothetical protein
MAKAGSKAEQSGIYACKGCRKEKTFRSGTKLAPCKCGGGDWWLVSATSKAKGKKKRGFLSSLFG